MNRIVASLVLIAMLVSSSFAAVPLTVQTDRAALEQYGRNAGCKNLEYVERASQSPNGAFMILEVDGKTVPFIRVVKSPGMAEQHKLTIFYHELGHCLQFEKGVRYEAPKHELEADTLGAGFACKEGMNGIKMTEELMDWFYEIEGYEGDRTHGTLEQRKAAARKAPECRKYL